MVTDLAVVAIFKNESEILKEWIEHYINQGVDHLFLIDNDSTDKYQCIVQPYIDNGKVTIQKDPTKHAQMQLYNTYFLKPCMAYTWCLICDLDEFVYARNGFDTIKEYLKSLDIKVSQISIPWKMFGSNGYNNPSMKQPSSVVKTFTRRINYNKDTGFQGVIHIDTTKYSFTKCIVRMRDVQSFDIHTHKIKNMAYNISARNNKTDIHPNNSFSKINEEILKESFLHLNHYPIQSYEWFMRVKSVRGSAATAKNDNVRTASYFRDFDAVCNDIEDCELALHS
jgi:hypothetical protein